MCMKNYNEFPYPSTVRAVVSPRDHFNRFFWDKYSAVSSAAVKYIDQSTQNKYTVIS